MENWDFFQQNVQTAQNATGSLQEQADIYAESWEAARNRATAAIEDVYDSLINDDFFIGLDKGFTPFLGYIANVIDGMGGMKGAIAGVGVLLNQFFGQKMAEGIRNIAYNLGVVSKKEIEQANALKQKAADLVTQTNTASTGDQVQATRIRMMQQEIELQNTINSRQDKFTILQKQEVAQRLQAVQILKQQLNLTLDRVEAAQREVEAARADVGYDRRGNQIDVRGRRADINRIIGSTGNRINATDDQDQALQKVIQKVEQLTEAYVRARRAREGLNQLSANNLGSDVKSLRELAVATGALSETQAASANVVQLRKALLALTQQATTSAEGIRALRNILIEVEAPAQVVDNFTRRLREMAEASAEANGQMDAFNNNINRTAQSALGKGLTTFSENVVNVATGISSVAFAMSSIQGISNVLESDASAGEKLITVLTNIGFLIPSLRAGYKALSAVKIIEATVTTTLADGTTVLTAAQNQNVIATTAARIASKLYSAALEEEAAKQATATATKLASIGVILGVVAAIAALGVGIHALIQEYNADAIAAEKAAKTSHQLSEAATEASDKLDGIRSSIEAYQGALDTLDSCVKGTDQWNTALEAVNQTVDELLSKYPELLKNADLFNNDGTLNAEVLQRALDEAEENATSAAAASIRGQVNATMASNQSQLTDTARRFIEGQGEHATNTGYTQNTGRTVSEDVQRVLNNFKSLGNSMLELSDVQKILSEGLNDDIDVTSEYVSAIYDLAQQQLKGINMIENANERITQLYEKQTGREFDASQSKLISSMQQNMYDSMIDALNKANQMNMKAFNEDASILSDQIFESTEFFNKSLTEAFNIAQGTDYQLARNGVRGTSENRTYAFMVDGDVKEYTVEFMEATIASAAALQKMGESAAEAGATLKYLSESVQVEGAEKGIQAYLQNGNFGSLTEEEFNKMVQDKGPTGSWADYLQDRLGKTDKELKELLGKNYADDFENAVNDFSTGFDEYVNGLLKAVQTSMHILQDQDSFKELTRDQQKQIADTLEGAYASTREGNQSALDTIRLAFKSLSEEDLPKFLDTIEGVDWSSTNVEQFADELEEAGINTNFTTEQLTAFVDAMKQAGNSTYESMQKLYAAIHDILDDLETGQQISAEDYATLGSEAQGYFQAMLDGTYRLIGNAEELRQVVEAAQIDKFVANVDTMKEKLTSMMNIQGYDLEGLNTQATDTFTGGQQIDVLSAYGAIDNEKALQLEESINSSDINEQAQAYRELANAMAELSPTADSLSAELESLGNTIAGQEAQIASSADSLKELRELYDQQKIGIEAFNSAAMAIDSMEDIEGLDTQELENYANYLQEIAEESDEVPDSLVENDEAARDFAKTNMKMNMDEKDAAAADLITDGCNMGIKSLHKYLNQYKG